LKVGLFYQNVCQNKGDIESVRNEVCDTETCFSVEIWLEGMSVTPPNIQSIWG